jgi:peptidase A4-like protein
MSDDAADREALSRMRACEPPPEGFDPHTAPLQVLRRHGLPRRPDPGREPDLAWLWKLAWARPPTFVKAELAIDRVMSGRDAQGRRMPEFAGINGWAGENSWAGIQRILSPGSDYAEPARCVFTQLRVPSVIPLGPDEPLAAAFWTGIDQDPDSTGILQAGVTAVVSPSGFFGGRDVSFYVWTEWFPAKPCYVSNFPVSSGDWLLIMVSADQLDAGNAFFHNLTTGQATSVDIFPPPNVTLSGTSVEWIVEAVTEYLPVFSTVDFATCIAGTSNGVFYPAPGSVSYDIEGFPDWQFGPTFTQAGVISLEPGRAGDYVVVRERAVNWAIP